MPHPELQRIALAAAHRISTHRHFDACCLDNRGSVIRAIIGDHEDAVVGSELGLNVPDGGKYSHSLVMGGNEYGRPMGAARPAPQRKRPSPCARQSSPPATSKNQTNVRRAGRQTIAITTPLNMAHIQSETPLRNANLHEIAMHFRLVGVYYEFHFEQLKA